MKSNRITQILAAGVLACGLSLTARAQIGGSGWSSQTVSFNVQWPYNVAENTRYWFTNSVYHCMVFSNDAPFEEGSTTLPRTEMRFNPDFTGGEIQYQANLMVPANENSYCIMQDHTGDAQSPTYGPVAIMLIWQSKDGGSVWNGYTGNEIGKNLGGTYFQLNVDHNIVTHTIKVWINSTLVVTEADNGATDYYFKNGVYEQNIGTPTHQMDTYIKNIHEWTSSGEQSLTGTYQIENVASDLSLNVSNNLTSNGACIVQYSYSGSANEKWTFTPTSGGYYQIVNVNSGKDVAVQGASTANEAKIVQWTFGSSGDDQWKPVQNSNGSYTFYNLNSGKVLDNPGSSMTKNTQMDQYTAQGGSNQQWNLISH